MSRMAAASWESRMVATVHDLISQGVTFERAWHAALTANPASLRDRRRVESWGGPATLFDGTIPGDDEPSVVEALRAYCKDAILGRRPELGAFTLESLRESDTAGPARRVMRSAA